MATYRTLSEKVQLFKDNNIDTLDYYENCSGPRQQIYLDGGKITAAEIERLATAAGIEILSMSLIYKYYGGKPSNPRWLVEFFYEPPPKFICPLVRFLHD